MSVSSAAPDSARRSLRILTLDGGGTRGIVPLFVLQDLMDRIKVEENLDVTPLPCEWFDLIVGTSTGGLIALMLGRLKMSVNNAINAYMGLEEKVLSEYHFRPWQTRFTYNSFEPQHSTEKLGAALRKITADTKLADPMAEPKCRVSVVAFRQEGPVSSLDLLRTYTADVAPYDCSVLDAARATCAATPFFPPASVHIRYGRQVKYLDGGLGYNPTRLAVEEAEQIWGYGSLGCIVSIGTGIPLSVRFEGNKLLLATKLQAISTACQAVHQNMSERFRGTQKGMYFRFDPPTNLDRMGLDEWKKLNNVAMLVHAYVQENSVKIGDCVTAITHRKPDPDQGNLDIVVREANQATPSISISAISNENVPKMDERDRQCLEDLRVSDPRHDKTRIEETNGGLLHDSYRWILENADFRQWRDEQESQLLWIKGDPGKGKTMLLCGIINELEASAAKIYLLSFFFCQATDSRINTATAVLRGLIYLLLDQQPYLICHVRKKYDHAGKALFEDVNAWFALSEILTNILQDPNLTSTFLIIDALDECLTDLPRLLDFIAKNSSAAPHHVKWIVSSRNWPDIEDRLETGGRKVKLSLELNAESVSAAVYVYIRHKVRELAELKSYDSKTETAVRTYLSSNANDTFLWVASVCKQLKETTRWNTIAKLNTFPPGLDTLYEGMIQQVYGSDDAEICKHVLSFVTIVYRPITLDELTSLVKLKGIASDDVGSWEELVGLCGSFLTIREGTIYFVHQSVKDFLLQRASSELFPHGMDEVHHAIFSSSLEAMSRTLRRNLYDLDIPGFPIDDVKRPEPDPFATIRYSCAYWVDHLYDASRSPEHGDDLGDNGAVYQFLRGKFIYWLEALSLLRIVSEGVIAMIKLEGLLQRVTNESLETHESQLMVLVRDIRRFILYFKWAIEHSPLQVYASGLVFTPVRSPTRELFKLEEPRWITAKPVMQDCWDACLQTLEGHHGSVNSVTFSHDSKYLGSASSDGTVKIWVAGSGQCLQTLEGHRGWVNSVAFSRNSKYLASASFDNTVKIWDTGSGRGLQTLEGHRGSVNSVTFSHDSTYLASASSDWTGKIWDAGSGQCLLTLEGHHDEVRSVAFSHDSKYLASASQDKTVMIWDTGNGQCLRTLAGHRDSVNSVIFSHDSKDLASASSDGTVKIWDTRSGECFRTLEGDRDSVNSVTFSHDSKYLGSASSDGTVKIWDAGSGQCQQTLEGHRGSVNSVAFSRNSKYLASASFDKAVKIWETGSGQALQTFEGHRGWVRSVTFSHDSKYLASASSDGTGKIWDAGSGQCLLTLEGHHDEVRSVAFSHDSKYLASASQDKTVMIWDTGCGQCLRTLAGHHDEVRSVAFSHDSKYLASASQDKTVMIWDTGSGQCLRTLAGHRDSVNSVTFSHDSKYLGSASSDGTVKIWDTSSGECLRTLEGDRDSVNSVTFSHDSKYLASASSDGTVKIWDIGSAQCQYTLVTDTGPLSNISFDNANSCLHTDFGDFVLDMSSSASDPAPTDTVYQTSSRRGYGISSDRLWIVWNAKNILWLPPEYRPSQCAVQGSSICIGCYSGRILIFNFVDQPSNPEETKIWVPAGSDPGSQMLLEHIGIGKL